MSPRRMSDEPNEAPEVAEVNETIVNRGSDGDVEADDWIPLSEAGFILKVRYLKVRDLASTGRLGPVKRNEAGRYFVRRSAVMAYERKRRGAQR